MPNSCFPIESILDLQQVLGFTETDIGSIGQMSTEPNEPMG